MAVRRINANIGTGDVEAVKRFYAELFGLDVLMDFGWIATLGGQQTAVAQVSIMSEGGSGAPVPDLSIEVDDLDQVYARAMEMGCEVTYALREEPWGVRRFFLLDPTGKTLNVVAHSGETG